MTTLKLKENDGIKVLHILFFLTILFLSLAKINNFIIILFINIITFINAFSYKFHSIVFKNDLYYMKSPFCLLFKKKRSYSKFNKIVITKHLIYFLKDENDYFLLYRSILKDKNLEEFISFFEDKENVDILEIKE